MEQSVNRLIVNAVEDGVVTDDEATKIIKAYGHLQFKSDLELKKWLKQHGFDIKLVEHTIKLSPHEGDIKLRRERDKLRQRVVEAEIEAKRAREYAGLEKRYPNAPSRPEPNIAYTLNDPGNSGILPKLPKLPRLTPKRKQRLIWLAIVGPATVASLILL